MVNGSQAEEDGEECRTPNIQQGCLNTEHPTLNIDVEC